MWHEACVFAFASIHLENYCLEEFTLVLKIPEAISVYSKQRKGSLSDISDFIAKISRLGQ